MRQTFQTRRIERQGQLNSLLEKRRELMQQWADELLD
jgi:hypothetical protein